jgi:hypothetical protein
LQLFPHQASTSLAKYLLDFKSNGPAIHGIKLSSLRFAITGLAVTLQPYFKNIMSLYINQTELWAKMKAEQVKSIGFSRNFLGPVVARLYERSWKQ